MQNRVSTRVHTRKLDRAVAHKNMKSAGYVKINKSYISPEGNFLPSLFSRRWREFINE